MTDMNNAAETSQIAFPRRTALALGLTAAAGLIAGSGARAAGGGIKVTVLYGAPMQKVTSTPEWKKIVDDVPNFASGGATVLVSKVE
jgi:hypothetical protein